jgi:hypothetical protein
VHRRGGDGGVDASPSDARYQELVARQLYTLRQRAVGPPLSALTAAVMDLAFELLSGTQAFTS